MKTHQFFIMAVGALALILMTTTPAMAQQGETATIYVDGDTTSSQPPADFGRNGWNEPHKHLQNAIADAVFLRDFDESVSDVRIWVKGNTVSPYRPDLGDNRTPGDRTETFELHNNIALLGGFRGDETAEGQRDPAVNVTVLSGLIGAQRSYHVLTAAGVNDTAILDGLTVEKGRADSETPPHGWGGGLLVLSGMPRIENCIFQDHYAISGCCSIFAGGSDQSSSPLILHCTFRNNTAENLDPDPSAFQSGFGGAIAAEDGAPNIINCIFHDNRTDNNGGAIYLQECDSVDVINCLFYRNEAVSVKLGGSGQGGAIAANESVIHVSTCTFTANVAAGGYAIYHHRDGLLGQCETSTVYNSILWADTFAPDTGEPDESDREVHVITPICNDNDTIIVDWCDVMGHDDLELLHSWYGSNNQGVDPMFSAPHRDDYRLNCTSPLLDAGNDNLLPPDEFDLDGNGISFGEPIPYELRGAGFPRVEGADVAFGAYERPIADPCEADIDNNSAVDIDDLLILLGDWGTCPGGQQCVSDIAPCGGDNEVGIDDLLFLLASWGTNCASGAAEDVPRSVEDCLEMYSDPAEQEACIEAIEQSIGK